MTLPEPDELTRDTFLEALRERVDALRVRNVEIPLNLDSDVRGSLVGLENPFESGLFRTSVLGLLEGLDPSMVEAEGGSEVVANRLHALSANLRLAQEIAAERREQRV